MHGNSKLWSVWILLGACWILFPLGPLSLAILILLPLALWRAVSSRSVVTIMLVCLANPLSFFFLRGMADYAGGRPSLRGMGLPGPEHANIDPRTRCRRLSGGCRVSGHEWVVIVPHNFALRALSFLLGPPADTYDGPYPTKEEALEASTPVTPVSPGDFVSGTIPTTSGTVRMDRAIAEKIGTFVFPLSGYATGDPLEDEQLHAALWHERCLILRWRGMSPPETTDETDEVVVLIDIRNSRPFAVYHIAGETSLRRAAIGMFWK